MEFSIFTAKILAVCYLSLGLGILFNQEYYKKGLTKMVESSSFLLSGGLAAIVVGFIILDQHNNWTSDWTVLITIVGWIALIKGVSLIVFPQIGPFYKRNILQTNNTVTILVPLLLLVGLVFGYCGFFY